MNFPDRVADKRDQIIRYVVHRLRLSHGEAEEIAHKAIAQALEKQHQFEGGELEGALVRWLETIAYREGLRARDPIGRKLLAAGTNDRSDSAKSPSAEHRLSDDHKRIYDAISCLSDNQRTVISWHFFDDLSVNEIASRLEMHESSVSRIKAKALEKLGTMLNPEDFRTMMGK